MKTKITLLLVVFLIIPLLNVHAQWGVVYSEKCQFADGETLFPRDNLHGQVELVSWVTGNVIQVLVDDPAVKIDQMQFPRWTYNCRYLTVQFGYDADAIIYLWEVSSTGASQIGRYTHAPEYHWSWHEQILVLATEGKTLVWHPGVSAPFFVEARYLQNLYLDGNQLYAVPTDRNGSVLVIDLGSGQIIHEYDLAGRWGGERGVEYEIHGDYILLGADHYRTSGGAVWHRTSGWNLQLAGQWRLWQTIFNVSVSPDMHYMVISLGGGTTYVYDLTALIGESPYRPNYSLTNRNRELGLGRGSVYWRFMNLRWQEGYILEGVKITDERTIEMYRWNVPENVFLYYDKVRKSQCDNAEFIATFAQPELLQWGCLLIQS